MPDLWTEDPRLAALYDIECAGRWDHDLYLALATELGAASVVDIGCGTGVFAVDAAAPGRRVIGVDPAVAMLDLARTRPGGERVEWIHGTADDIPDSCADLVIMMGHVAQYFVADDQWTHLLGQVRRMLMPGGHLAFETRNPLVDWSARWTHAPPRWASPRRQRDVAISQQR
ncbi:MAG: class I SAM-dependent methyltransferase [Acidimicrobiia bacterium]|nr:class I SAM-dependent methyltransferase [Acidimicrobiia bacterium]